MTEPITPTGKREVRAAKGRLGHGMYMQWEWPDINDVILAIEQEAAAQERERLRHQAIMRLPRWDQVTLADVQAVLADPEPIVVGHTPPFDSVEKGERP